MSIKIYSCNSVTSTILINELVGEKNSLSGYEIHLGKKEASPEAFFLGIQPPPSPELQQKLEEQFGTHFGIVKQGRDAVYAECIFYESRRRITEIATNIGAILNQSGGDQKIPVIIDPTIYRVFNKPMVEATDEGVLLTDGYLFPGATQTILSDPRVNITVPFALEQASF